MVPMVPTVLLVPLTFVQDIQKSFSFAYCSNLFFSCHSYIIHKCAKEQ